MLAGLSLLIETTKKTLSSSEAVHKLLEQDNLEDAAIDEMMLKIRGNNDELSAEQQYLLQLLEQRKNYIVSLESSLPLL